jgi:transcriptional repressor NrdR
MQCPYCFQKQTSVLDSRESENSVRRRRECSTCSKRFTTYELIKEEPITVIKKDGRKETYNREKLFTGMLKACEKRPVKRERIIETLNEIESILRTKGEVKSRTIGNLVMDKLKKTDAVAYVRFASVYHGFKNIRQFKDAVEILQRKTEILS